MKLLETESLETTAVMLAITCPGLNASGTVKYVMVL